MKETSDLEKEIFTSYANPVSILELYENILDFDKESNVQITSFYENNDSYIRSYLNQIDEEFACTYSDFNKISTEKKHQKFINDDFFKSLLRIVCFQKNSSSDTRKTETFYNEKEYCLYFKGYRLSDNFIDKLLPEKIFESQSYYNDSTPKERIKENSTFYLSLLESERFIEKYNLEEHYNFLLAK